jgi:hypothetical protein
MSRDVKMSPLGYRRGEKGDSLIIIVVFIFALFGLMALSVDVGNVYVQRKAIQSATDAAALAAVKDWALGESAGKVTQVANDFGGNNGLKSGEILSVTVGKWIHAARQFVPENPLSPGAIPAVEVKSHRLVASFFGTVVGFSGFDPNVRSVAVVAAARCANTLPWAACDQSGIITQQHCTPVTLKYSTVGPGTNSCGATYGSANFGALALGGTGASDYRENVVNDSRVLICIGDCVDTEPGNMVGPTIQGLQERIAGLPAYVCTTNPDSEAPNNKRTAIIPKVEVLQPNGRGQVCVTGFYTIVLDDYDNSTKSVQARFISVFGGTGVDDSRVCIAGDLCGIALVE